MIHKLPINAPGIHIIIISKKYTPQPSAGFPATMGTHDVRKFLSAYLGLKKVEKHPCKVLTLRRGLSGIVLTVLSSA